MKRYFISIMIAICNIITFCANAISYVDLGLPSGKLWATENIGTNVSKWNAYYAWGELKPNKNGVKDSRTGNVAFTWSTYMNERKNQHVYLMNPDKKNNATLTWGYFIDSVYKISDRLVPSPFASNNCGTLSDPLFSVVYDNTNAKNHESRRLPLSFDAANLVDDNYEIPSKNDFQELINNCTVAFKSVNGFNHYVFTSKKNGKTIAFPASGQYDGNVNGPKDVTSSGYYWTSDPTSLDAMKSYCVKLTNTLETVAGSTKKVNVAHTQITSNFRYLGYSIRPIKRKTPYKRTTSLNIGIGEPTVELTGIMASDYADKNYVSEVARAIGFNSYRIWVNFSELYKKIPGDIYDKYQTDSYGDPVINYDYINKIKELVTSLKNNGVKQIAIVPTNFAAERSPYIYTYDGNSKKFKWIKVNEVNKYPNRQDLIWHQNIPAPGDADYNKFLEDQEWAYYDLAYELKQISGVDFYFEGPNEPDGGLIMNGKVAGDKYTLLNWLCNTDLLKNKYNIEVSNIEDLGFNSTFLTKKTLAKFLVDLSYHINRGVKDASRNFKVLSPSFMTLGTTFITLRDMYEEISKKSLNSDKDPNKYFEILNIHPYLFMGTGDVSCGCKNIDDWKSHMMELQRICLDNGHNVPVWITEMGFSTKQVTEQQSVELLKRQLDLMSSDKDLSFVQTVIVFRMIDDRNNDGFGILGNLRNEDYIGQAWPLKLQGQMLYFYINRGNAPMSPKNNDEISDLENVSSELNINVYPNPSRGLIHIVSSEDMELQHLSVKDAMGKTVISQDANGNLQDIDLTLLKRGIYFIEIVSNQGITVKKILLN